MSTPLTTSSFNVSASSRTKNSLPNWVREPLVHFLVLGALLFAIEHFISSRADDPRTIVVGAAVDREARDLFKASRGREPTDKELSALRQVWLDNEVLYREGLAMQVDKGDATIRERVIFKALNIVETNVKVPPADDKVLREWFERHRNKYDEPARFNFEEAVLSGDRSEAAVRSFVAELNGGVPGDAKAGLRVFKGRPRVNLVESYGTAFTAALEEAPPAEWRAMEGRDGWRAIRLDSITPEKRTTYEPLRGVVMHDWIDATAAQQRTDAVRALAQKYKVQFEAATK